MRKYLTDGFLLRKLILRSVILPLTDEMRAKLKAAGITTRRQKPCMCWIKSTRGGYGRLWNGKELEDTHRISFRLHKGPIPEGHDVLHHCDVTRCWEPSHLWTGTQVDNNADRHAKGRTRNGADKLRGKPALHLQGARHPKAKLTPQQVRRIRQMGAANPCHLPPNLTIGSLHTRGGFRLNLSALARQFEVSEGLVRGIIKGDNWGWLT